MKVYIVYVNGVEVGTIKASSHNAAEKKAAKKHPNAHVSVAYTKLSEKYIQVARLENEYKQIQEDLQAAAEAVCVANKDMENQLKKLKDKKEELRRLGRS